MIGFTQALAAVEASRNVSATCIAPGFISSPMPDVLNDSQSSALLTKIPAGRLGAGAVVAAAAVFLASEEAGYMTGQTLHVNGGMAMI
jgi:3-oxoacyl-[acyl-carrier protein] reductase